MADDDDATAAAAAAKAAQEEATARADAERRAEEARLRAAAHDEYEQAHEALWARYVVCFAHLFLFLPIYHAGIFDRLISSTYTCTYHRSDLLVLTCLSTIHHLLSLFFLANFSFLYFSLQVFACATVQKLV